METKNKYEYVITQDICNILKEVVFLWDIWFLGQIVYFKIEHPSIINKIRLGLFNMIDFDFYLFLKEQWWR